MSDHQWPKATYARRRTIQIYNHFLNYAIWLIILRPRVRHLTNPAAIQQL